MVLNIHPIFIHIPIAFLSVYSVAEMVRYKKVTSKDYWPIMKAVFLVIGILGAFASLQTGELAESAYRGTDLRNVVEVHSSFAAATTWFFVALLVLYLAHFVKDYFKNEKISKVVSVVDHIYQYLIEKWPSVLVGIVGLTLITITGALGGAIVYGSTADPIVSFVYGLFF